MEKQEVDISQSFDRVELWDLGKPRWHLLYSGSKGRELQFEQEDSILCPDPGDLDGEY